MKTQKKLWSAFIVLPTGKVEHPKKGVPQGGVLSPLLSNIILNELDWWVASQWQNTTIETEKIMDRRDKGKGIDKTNQYRALRRTNLKEIYIVRYADDFKIFCRKRSHADKIFLLKRVPSHPDLTRGYAGITPRITATSSFSSSYMPGNNTPFPGASRSR